MTATKVITLLGPTAAGKTQLAALVAAELTGEVVSADSRQVYRGMTIGTGKDLEDYCVNGQHIPHHLIDIVDPGYEYNLFEYQRDCRIAIRSIRSRNALPILCGGSGMYVSAMLQDFELAEIPPNPERHETLKQQSDEQLIALLATLKTSHNVSDTSDRQRLIRAIEIAESGIAPPERFPLESTTVGIQWEREILRARITKRLKSRLKHGLIEEVQGLLDQGLTPDQLRFYGLEYRFVTDFLTGSIPRDKLLEQLMIAIHQFAKRQETWFRRMQKKGVEIHWIPGGNRVEENVELIVTLFQKKDSSHTHDR